MIKLLSLTAIAAGAAVACMAPAAPAPKPAPEAAWQLVQYFAGEAYVLDHNLTHDDCDDAMPRSDAAKGLRFTCELER